MNITSGTAPFLRGKRTTRQIMSELLMGLAVIFLAAVIYNFTIGVRYGFKVIGIMVVSILFTFISDLIAGSFRFNKEKDGVYADYMINFVKSNYSIVTAVIFALTIPVGTPVYVVAIGSMFATLLVKHAFGGFGSNIFNPSVLGRLFLVLAFSGQLKAYFPGGENLSGLTAGVTVTTGFAGSGTKFLTSVLPSNVSMLDLWLGRYSGALGETFTILILIVGVVLAAREVINWRTPVFMFLTVALSSVFLALIAGVNVFQYLLTQFGLGGLVFAATFMLTDPVTSPTSNLGKALIGVLTGFFNMLIRLAGSYPEGPAFSIAIVNVFTPMIDKLISGRTNVKMWKPYTTMGVAIVLSVGLLSGVSAAKMAGARTDDPSSSEPSGLFDHELNLLGVANIDSSNDLTITTELSDAGVSAKREYLSSALRVGIIYTAEIKGYKTGLVFEVAFKNDVFAGFNVVSSNETNGLGATYLEGVNDAIVGVGAGEPVLVDLDYTGVTMTRNPVKATLELIGKDYLATDGDDAPFATFKGSYTSPKPHKSQNEFTTNVIVGVNDQYHIISLTYDVLSSPGYVTEEDAAPLIAYYTSISVAEFKKLPVPMLTDDTTGATVGAQTGDHILPDFIYTSRALYEAIKDALKNIEVYFGEETSLPTDKVDYELTFKVNVYVDKTSNKIQVVEILDGSNTTNWQTKWDAVSAEVLALYHDLDVTTFLGYTSEAELMDDFAGLVSGVSWSPRRLFSVVQKALEGYGS